MASFRKSFDKLRKRVLSGKKLFGANETPISYLSAKPTEPAADISFDRYEHCYILWKIQVSAVIWFEDLLVLHDSEIQLQNLDLRLLVQDPREAAETLRSAGYEEASTNAEFENEPEYAERGKRMVLPSADTDNGVVLLPARDWYYNLDESAEGFLPPLHDTLDSMMEFWLGISSQNHEDRLLFALYIGRLINYCYSLEDEDGNRVKEPAYSKILQPSHHELHYDIVSEDPKADSFTITKRHQYHVRRSNDIKDGLFTPQPYQKGVHRPDLTTLTE